MSDSPPPGNQAKAAPKKPRQGRSPAFPFISIEKALERAEVFRVAEGGRPKHFSPVNSAFAAWKMGPKTGPAAQTIAALGHYGLFEFQGSGDARSARLTETALNILLDKQPVSAERDHLVGQAALKPAIHTELWIKWGDALPSDPTLETYLVRDRGFSETGARDLIAEYKATIEYAKLGQSAIIPAIGGPEPGEETPPVDIAIGDLVNVERNGVLVFPKAVRVRAMEEHGGQRWVWTDGSEAWTEMENVTLEAKDPGVARAPPPRPTFSPLDAKAGVVVRTAVFPLPEGDVTITYPAAMSDESLEQMAHFMEPIIHMGRWAKKAAPILYPDHPKPGDEQA